MRRLMPALLAAAMIAPAIADIPPPPPDNPIPDACKPLIGVWQRETPIERRRYQAWTILAVDSSKATMLVYGDQASGINIEAVTGTFAITCEAGADKKLAVKLKATSGLLSDMDIDLTWVDASHYTTQEMTSYTSPGAPDPNWKPEPVTVRFKKIVP